MVDLDQSFSWETSALGTMVLMEQLKKLQPTLDEEAKALFKKIK